MCGQPSLGMRSRRAASRRNQGEGRRRGQGEGRRRGDRGRRRRRTTPSFLDNSDDVDDDEVMSQGYGRRTRIPQTTTLSSSSTTTRPLTSRSPADVSLWKNTTDILDIGVLHNNESLTTEEHISAWSTTTVATSVFSSSLSSTTDARARRTRKPRRNRNRGSRRRKNRRTVVPMLRVTTEPVYYPDSDEHPLWGIDRQRQHHGGGATSRLEQLIADIRRTLTMNRHLVTQMPRALCSDVTSTGVTERRCWNGTSYSRSVALM